MVPMKQVTTYVELAAWPLIFAGFGHALLVLPDIVVHGLFSPPDERVRQAMETSSIVFLDLFRGSGSIWKAYVGFNVSHGVGIGFFALVNLLIARSEPELYLRLPALLRLDAAVCAILFASSLAFWFYAPAILTGWSLVFFVLALRGVRLSSRSEALPY